LLFQEGSDKKQKKKQEYDKAFNKKQVIHNLIMMLVLHARLSGMRHKPG
jgi:hypothetical protein